MIWPKGTTTKRDETRNYEGEVETGGTIRRYQTNGVSMGWRFGDVRRAVRLRIMDMGRDAGADGTGRKMAADDWSATWICPQVNIWRIDLP